MRFWLVLCLCGCAAPHFPDEPAPVRHISLTSRYPLVAPTSPQTVCPVSGQNLAPYRIAVIYKGREIQVCCEGCLRKFEAHPEKYLRRNDAKIPVDPDDPVGCDRCGSAVGGPAPKGAKP